MLQAGSKGFQLQGDPLQVPPCWGCFNVIHTHFITEMLDDLAYLVAWTVELLDCILLDAVDDARYLLEDVQDFCDPYLRGSPAWKVASWITKREAEVCGTIKVGFARRWLFLKENAGGRRLKFVRAPFWLVACWFSDREDQLIVDLEELGWNIEEG